MHTQILKESRVVSCPCCLNVHCIRLSTGRGKRGFKGQEILIREIYFGVGVLSTVSTAGALKPSVLAIVLLVVWKRKYLCELPVNVESLR